MAGKTAHWDLLLAVMGAPHVSDMTTTVLRLIQAALDQGARVQVWTCGYATLLTQCSLGNRKPRNLMRWSTDYPSTAALVRDLVTEHEARMSWCVCRFCSEERGATAHIPPVRIRPPFKFVDHVAQARKTLLIGVI